MVQKSSNEVEVNMNKPVYLYYMATRSEPCSPSDTLDSGTGSDLENTPSTNHVQSHQIGKTMRFSTTMNNHHNDLHHLNHHHQRGINGERSDAYNIDSEESETSLSCDSLNSGESHRHISSPNDYHRHHKHHTRTNIASNNTSSLYISDDHHTNHQITKIGFLPHSLLRDIRDRSTNRLSSGESDESTSQVSEVSENAYTSNYAVSSSSSDDRNDHGNDNQHQQYVEKMVAKNTGYENDKYYNFHINEYVLDIIKDEPANKCRDDDSFAGYKDIENGTSTIRSSKGTVRGVKNRVRNGIATFLQMQQSNVKNYKEKDAGKVVLYSTSMGIVRETYAKCANVKQILRTLLIKFDERDIFMSKEYQLDIKDRMQTADVQVPQLFVDGQYIGNAEQVERLNESGELRQMLKIYKCLNSSYICPVCGGYRLLPCPSCNGSKKSVHRNHFTTEFVALKCMNCDEVGLVKCYSCN